MAPVAGALLCPGLGRLPTLIKQCLHGRFQDQLFFEPERIDFAQVFRLGRIRLFAQCDFGFMSGLAVELRSGLSQVVGQVSAVGN